MISRRGKFGAAFVVAVLLMAVIGGWLGNQDQQQMAVAHAPAHKVIAPPASPEIPPPVNQAMPARIVKPMGPFAPPLPDLPLSQEEKPLPVEGGRVELDTKHPSQTATVAPDAVIAHPAPETILPPPAPSGSSGRSSGLQPQAWTRNAIAAPANPGLLPMIAIVIDDLGSAPAHAAAALALPAPVTMAVLPYAHNAAQLASTARLRGHEVLVHLPMEVTGSTPVLPTIHMIINLWHSMLDMTKYDLAWHKKDRGPTRLHRLRHPRPQSLVQNFLTCLKLYFHGDTNRVMIRHGWERANRQTWAFYLQYKR